MKLARAKEQPLEYHGDQSTPPGSVRDWQVDRLVSNLAKIQEVFDQAVAAQSKVAPVSQESVMAFQAGLQEITSAAKIDDRTLADLTATTDRIVSTLDSPFAKTVIFGEQESAEAVMKVEMLAHKEFGTSTFYGISQDACNANVKLERLCERAHALVAAGYVGEKELEGVRVAVTDVHSIKARASEMFYSSAVRLGMSPKDFPPLQEESYSYFSQRLVGDKDPIIKVNVNEAKNSNGRHADPVVATFTHEVGHWLARDKTEEMVRAGIDAIRASNGPNAQHLDKFFPAEDLANTNSRVHPTDEGGILTQELRPNSILGPAFKGSTSWTALAGEMQGDLMALVGDKAEFGNKAALFHAAELISHRSNEAISGLERIGADAATVVGQGMEANIRFGEEHNTTAALVHFAEKIRSGELDKVQTPEQLDRLMGESIVHGLVEQYVQVRSAELNIHHLEDGKVVPGLPPGVDIRDVLAAEQSSIDFRYNAGEPTILLTEAQASNLPEGAARAELDLPGKDAGETGQRFVLADQAPEGINMPEISKDVQTVNGYEVAGAMAPFANEINSQREAYLEGPGREEARAAGRDDEHDTGRDATLTTGAQASSERPAPEPKAEAEAPSMEMSM